MTNIHTEEGITGYMGQLYPYSEIWEETIVAILHNYGAKAISYYSVITKTPYISNIKYKIA